VEGEGPDALVRIVSSERVAFHAGLLRNFIESYIVAARALEFVLASPMPAKDLLKKALGLGDRMFLTGEIAQREAVCKPNIENALQSFRDAGYLSGGEGGPQRLAAGHDTAEAVKALEAGLRAFAT
jgi:glycerol-3-phosphate O-acyltransferase